MRNLSQPNDDRFYIPYSNSSVASETDDSLFVLRLSGGINE